jgi:hypothetical protein
MQDLPGRVVQGIAVPHQGQGVLPGIAPSQEKAEIRGGFFNKDQFRFADYLQNGLF